MKQSKQIPKGTWQADMVEKGFSFPDLENPAPTRHELSRVDECLRDARIGKTVIESYLSGEVRRVVDCGQSHMVEVVREAFIPPAERLVTVQHDVVQPIDNPGFYHSQYGEVA